LAKSIRWLGHATFAVNTAKDKVIYFDPFLTGNPLCPISLDKVDRADLVLVSHDHFDHVGAAADIVKKTGATLVAQPETVGRLVSQLGVPPDRACNFGSGMNIGGSTVIDGITITMTQAFHSSQTGSCAGFIVKLEDGFTLYHAGDTGIFADMKTIGQLYPIDLALLPIGSIFTMDPYQASKALGLLNPKRAIPMHYGTFPILEQTADRFVELAKKEAPKVRVSVLSIGREYAL